MPPNVMLVCFLEILANAFQLPHVDGDCPDDYPRVVVPKQAFPGDGGIVGCLPKVVEFAVPEELFRPIGVVASVIGFGLDYCIPRSVRTHAC